MIVSARLDGGALWAWQPCIGTFDYKIYHIDYPCRLGALGHFLICIPGGRQVP